MTGGDRIRTYLESHGIGHPAMIHDIQSGFDLTKPVYETDLDLGTRLYQYIRKPAAGRPDMRTGNWFCITGARRSSLAILDGLAGRQLHAFQVVVSFRALEGTASTMTKDWHVEIGGRGGATQLFVPRSLLGRLESVGPATEW